MKRYLVTGGCGFIGSHLCDALRGDGHAVRVLDDLSTGRRDQLPPGTELLIGDIADPAMMARAVDGVDGCFHLAAVASVERGGQDWLGTHRTNLTGTITLFEAIRTLPGAARMPVVYASSAAVYGDPAGLPLEESAFCQPLSAYGADKYGCELHARVATRGHGIPTTGLRFFNVYGPRQDPRSPYSGVISIFCDRIAAGTPVEVFGDGAQTRDFIHVRDVAVALRAAMGDLERQDTPAARVFNICTGQSSSVRDVATTIARLSDQPARLIFQPARAREIRHSRGAPDQARAVLGFSATITLSDGLQDVLSWLRAGSRADPG